MSRSVFPYDIFAELERMQRAMNEAFELTPNIRGFGHGRFPALNIGGTPDAVEIYAFVPGVEPTGIEIHLEQGALSIAGERKSALPAANEKAAVHINERFSGAFRRVISLPDDIDPDTVCANCRDGVLHISIKRSQTTAPRRIAVQ